MRLTLRTLLSWKDGMLSQSDAAEIAAKVASAPAAARIEERIGAVVGRQSLAAPPIGWTTAEDDANATAEYLDNVMPAQRIAEFERLCFASDVRLAETAACHEILAGLVREPVAGVDVDAATRTRLLAAARSAAVREPGSPGTAATGTAAPDPARPASPWPAGGEPAHPGVSFVTEAGGNAAAGGDGVRPRPQRAPASAWFLLVTATVLLAVLCGVLGWSLRRGGARSTAAPQRDLAGPAQDAAAAVAVPEAEAASREAAGPTAAAAAPTADDGAAAVAAAQPSAPPAAPSAAPAAGTIAPPVPAVESAEPQPAAAVADGPPPAPPEPAAIVAPPPVAPVSSPAMAPGEPRVPQGDALAIVAPPPAAAQTVEPAGAPAAPDRVDAGPAADAPPGDVTVEGDAVVLVRTVDAEPREWRAAFRGMPLALPLDLIAPAFSQPVVVVDGMRIALQPGSRATLTRNAAQVPRLELLFGAALATSANPGARLAVAAGGLVGTVTDGLTAPVGIEVALHRKPGVDPAATETRVRIVAAGGQVAFAQDGGRPLAGIAAEQVLSGAQLQPPARSAAVEWSSVDPAAAAVVPVAAAPGWVTGRAAVEPRDRAAGQALADKLRHADGVRPALGELARDRRGENRMAAAVTLALLGDYEPLVEQLCADDPKQALHATQWRRLESLGVPLALARGANAAARLSQAFVDRGPPGSGTTLAEFARGHDDAALDAGAAATLVAALESPHLVVRRYAIKNLEEIAEPSQVDRLRYRPEGLPEQLREGAAWWRGQLERGRIRRAGSAAPAERGADAG